MSLCRKGGMLVVGCAAGRWRPGRTGTAPAADSAGSFQQPQSAHTYPTENKNRSISQSPSCRSRLAKVNTMLSHIPQLNPGFGCLGMKEPIFSSAPHKTALQFVFLSTNDETTTAFVTD